MALQGRGQGYEVVTVSKELKQSGDRNSARSTIHYQVQRFNHRVRSINVMDSLGGKNDAVIPQNVIECVDVD